MHSRICACLQDYKEEFSLKDAINLAIKVLAKTMDSTTLSSEKRTCLRTHTHTHTHTCLLHSAHTDRCVYVCFAVEFGTLTKNAKGEVVWQILSDKTVDQLLKDADIASMRADEDANK